jgi:hypothetical protein
MVGSFLLPVDFTLFGAEPTHIRGALFFPFLPESRVGSHALLVFFLVALLTLVAVPVLRRLQFPELVNFQKLLTLDADFHRGSFRFYHRGDCSTSQSKRQRGGGSGYLL